MKSKYIVRTAFAFAVTAGLVACGGDRHGANTSTRATTGFPGVWMAESTYADFTLDGGTQLCAAVKAHPSRHGLRMSRYGIPGVRILKITNEGDVYRWSPLLRLKDPQFNTHGYFVGRVNAEGASSAAATYGSDPADGLGTLRLLAPDRMAQVAGKNPFTVEQRNRRGVLIDLRDPDLDFTFKRVGEAFARSYLEALRRCEPLEFSTGTEPAPPNVVPPTVTRPAPPTRPTAPARTPEPIAPTGGYIPEE